MPAHRTPSRRAGALVLSMLALTLIVACSSTDAPVAESDPTESTGTTSTEAALTPTPSDGRTSDGNVTVSPAPASTSATTMPSTSTTSAPIETTTTTTTTTPTATPATTAITTIAAPTATTPDLAGPIEQLDLTAPISAIGWSVQGQPIIAERLGTPGGRRVLVIGVIHGNEDAGVQIVDELRTRPVPDGVELWLVESMNPDGQAAQIRQNANGVDLNRNFPHEWGPIGQRGDSQYAGPSAASEPETRTMVDFIGELRPDIAIWYHQDANLVIPSTGRDGQIRARYAELTGLPIAECCDGGGIYTGIAATWARVELKRDSDAVPFIVELPGGELDATQVDQHSTAVLTIAGEG